MIVMPSEPGQVTAAELGELLQRAAHVFARRGIAAFAEHDLSPARVRLIVTVGESPSIKMSELATRLAVTNRAITPLADGLEAEGLLVREADPTDRRAFRLTLTDRGQDVRQTISALQQSVSDHIFGAIPQPDRDHLARLLRAFLT